jgi:hypothetical protein
MLRKVLGSVVVLAVFCGFVSAETLKGKITKIEGKTLSFATVDKETKKVGEAKEYKIADDVKVMVGGKEKKELAGGLTNERLTKFGKKGINATIEVNEGVVTAITIAPAKKPKANN